MIRETGNFSVKCELWIQKKIKTKLYLYFLETSLLIWILCFVFVIIADAMISTGLAALGYQYVNLGMILNFLHNNYHHFIIAPN